MGLGIHTLIDGELDWLVNGDGWVDADGYFSYLWEAQEKETLAAMCAGATAAAAGDLLAQSPILELGPVVYPSELIGVNQGREQRLACNHPSVGI